MGARSSTIACDLYFITGVGNQIRARVLVKGMGALRGHFEEIKTVLQQDTGDFFSSKLTVLKRIYEH